MPTYEYECGACRHHFEEFQSMSDPTLKKCPSCGKRRLLRLIGTGAGIIFKGSGFYETDYKRKSPPGKKEGESGEKVEAKPDSKSESKPESKADSKPESKPKPEPKQEARAKKSDAPKGSSRKGG